MLYSFLPPKLASLPSRPWSRPRFLPSPLIPGLPAEEPGARLGLPALLPQGPRQTRHAANLRTKILDFRGFDSSRTLIARGGIPRPIGNFPKSLSQAILVGIIVVGRLGVKQIASHVHPCGRYTVCTQFGSQDSAPQDFPRGWVAPTGSLHACLLSGKLLGLPLVC